jgi:hypothetical protein
MNEDIRIGKVVNDVRAVSTNTFNRLGSEYSFQSQDRSKSIRQRAEFDIHQVRLNLYFRGNRSSRLLSNRLCSNDRLEYIATIESESGELLMTPRFYKITVHL